MHNTRRAPARKRVMQVRERSGGRDRDALTAAVTPHVDTSSLADGDARVIVVQGGDVGHPSHFVFDLTVQLLIMKSFASFFFSFVLCFLYGDDKGNKGFSLHEFYQNWITGVRLVADPQLTVTVPAPDIELPFIREHQRVHVSASHLD